MDKPLVIFWLFVGLLAQRLDTWTFRLVRFDSTGLKRIFHYSLNKARQLQVKLSVKEPEANWGSSAERVKKLTNMVRQEGEGWL